MKNNLLLKAGLLTMSFHLLTFAFSSKTFSQCTQTLNYTGGTQTFTVPAGITCLQVDVRGAEGGKASYCDDEDSETQLGSGGNGGHVTANISVTPGEILTIVVGGAGQDAPSEGAGSGGYNGGGNGSNNNYDCSNYSYGGGGGGGASEIRRSSTILVISGGGGGANEFGPYNGGSGGGLTGGTGQCQSVCATGGTQSAGGTGCNSGTAGTGGNACNGGGGGGGGYYGGGGGNSRDAGGGGSSYTIPGSENVVHTQGYQNGNGQVILAWDYCASSCNVKGIAVNTTGNSADPNAVLDVEYSAKGFLFPRLTTSQRDAIQSPATGLFVYNSTTDRINYWDGSDWKEFVVSSSAAVNPAGTNPGPGTAVNIDGSPPHHSAMFDIQSITGGFLFPRLTTTARDYIVSPPTGLLIYNTSTGNLSYYNGSTWIDICAITTTGSTGSTINTAGISINETGANPDASSILDVYSTKAGVLIPRLSTAQRDAILSPAEGLTIYNNTTNRINYYAGSSWYTDVYIPADFAATGVTNVQQTYFTANWNTSTDAFGYYLDVDDNSDFSSPLAGYNNLDVGNVTSYDVTGLTCGNTYYYRVRAYNTCGNSNYSNTITVCLQCSLLSRCYSEGRPTSIAQLADSGYFVAGYRNGSGYGKILRLDQNGYIIWQREYGNTTNCEIRSMIKTSDGGLIATGGAFWIIKLDVDANIQWQKGIGSGGPTSIIQTGDGGYAVLGNYGGIGLLLKLDNTGNISWQKSYDIDTYTQENFKCIQQTSDNGYIISGRIYKTGEQYDGLILKLDNTGTVEWTKKVYGDYWGVTSIVQTSDNGYAFIISKNTFGNSLWIYKSDNNGNFLWRKIYAAQAVSYPPESIIQTSDNGLAISCQPNYGDIPVLKINSAGTLLWHKKIPLSLSSSTKTKIIETNDGGYAVAANDSNNNGFCIFKLDANGVSNCSNTPAGSLIDMAAPILDISCTVSNTGYTLSNTNVTVVSTNVSITVPCSCN